jgi:hypothetical protein
MEAEHNVMELMNYKLRVQHAATTSEEEDISSKKVKPGTPLPRLQSST